MTTTHTDWTDCGTLDHGTVSARREGDRVRISYRGNGGERADDGRAITDAVERTLRVWTREAHDGAWTAAEGDGEVVQTVRVLETQPTHEILWTPAGGATQSTLVALVDGVAYTSSEWRSESAADWEVVDGEWRCQGQATPGGANGEVVIRAL